ncbi:MAG TPA: pilus assembly protein PilM [Vicinamibacterales bacterium]|jgi:Tfp pilus assembly PilM family ATPase|nr:pilus assembly protein PilM [Vicinamibacterales bacterium]
MSTTPTARRQRHPFDLMYAPPPTVAVEIAARRVSAALVEPRGDQFLVSAHASEILPAGTIVPSLTAQNILNPNAVVNALDRVFDAVGRPRRVGLVLPDPVARVSLIKFEQVPARPQDLDQLVRWQTRKAAPFSIDEAQVSHAPGARAEDGQEFIVSIAKRAVIAEYEGVCSTAGAHAGVVDISTFNVINTLLAASTSPSGDWLLINVAPEYASIAILRGADLIFFRNRASEGDGSLTDLVHQTAMYYEDRLQGTGFAHVLLTGASLAAQDQPIDLHAIRRGLAERLRTAVEIVDARQVASLADRITAGPALLDTLAPLVGLLVRDRGAAA